MSIRRRAGAVLLVCFCFFAAMTVGSRVLSPARRPVPATLNERWRPDLARVASVDEAMRLLPAYAARESGSHEARTAAAIDAFVRERFFHGASELDYRQNWLAYLAGTLWLDLRIPVLPDEILQHRRAICSQQAIVFMELLKRNGIGYASVPISWPSALPLGRGHFAVAARVDGRWLYFDPDQEVAQNGIPIERVIDGSGLQGLYGGKPELLAAMRSAAASGGIRLAHVNTYPAPRGGLFQTVARWLSRFGWLPLGLLGLALAWPRRRGVAFAAPAPTLARRRGTEPCSDPAG